MCEEKHSISDFNCSIAQLIESAEGLDFEDALEDKAKRNDISIVFDKEYRPILVQADEQKISQVLTNLLVNSIIEQLDPAGIEPFGMFEFTKLGLIFLGVGTIYNLIVAKWFIPSRAIVSSLTQKYHISRYLTEYKIRRESNIVGKSCEAHQFVNKGIK